MKSRYHENDSAHSRAEYEKKIGAEKPEADVGPRMDAEKIAAEKAAAAKK